MIQNIKFYFRFDYSGGFHDRISLLDDHVNEYLCCLSKKSFSTLFDDVYIHGSQHFSSILSQYNCPKSTLKIFCDTLNDENFKGLIKLCVNKLVKFNTDIRYRDSSTDSNESSKS